MKLKKSHYVLLAAIPAVLAGILVFDNFDFNVTSKQSSNFLANALNPFQTPTHEKLSANLVKSVENLCYGIAPTKNMGACDTMEFIFTGFVSSFPPLDSDNKFDVQHCERVNTILYELDKVMYRDNYQEDGFFDLPDKELRKKVTISFLENNQMSMSYYDVTYSFVEDLDELLLFWNDAYNKSCQS